MKYKIEKVKVGKLHSRKVENQWEHYLGEDIEQYKFMNK